MGLLALFLAFAFCLFGRFVFARSLGLRGILPTGSRSRRALVPVGGALANYLAAAALAAVAYHAIGGLMPIDGALVDEVLPGSAAEAAGLRRGDAILAVDGRAIQMPYEVSQAVERTGEPVVLRLERDGAPLQLRAAPRVVDGHYRIGIRLDYRTRPVELSPSRCIARGLAFPARYAEWIARERPRADAAGPVGIARAKPSPGHTAMQLAAGNVWLGPPALVLGLILALAFRRRTP